MNERRRYSPPPLMLPQNKKSFERFKQFKWKQSLPTEYKKVMKALTDFELNRIPLEESLNPNKNKFIKEMHQLAEMVLKRTGELIYLLDETQILVKHKFLNPWMAKLLITEMLWGKQYLKSGAKEVEAIKYYEETLRELYIKVSTIIKNPCDKLELPVCIRINTITVSVNDVLIEFCKEDWNLVPRCNTYADYLRVLTHLQGKNFTRDYHLAEVLVFPPNTSFYNHPGFLQGKFLIQDKGSCLSSFLLNPEPGSVVLDMCAAPGTKTNHLANIMGNSGLIYANDIHPDRLAALRKLMNLTNVTCVQPLQDDNYDIRVENADEVKYILIDPTCTFSGIFFGASSKTAQSLRIKRNKTTLSVLLRSALQKFLNVTRVVFTTSSLYPEEGEIIVDDALNEVGNSFTLLNAKEMLWNEWEHFGSPDYVCGRNCLRIIPEGDLSYGYFIAVFERNFAIPVPPYSRRLKKRSKDRTDEDMEEVEETDDFTSDIY